MNGLRIRRLGMNNDLTSLALLYAESAREFMNILPYDKALRVIESKINLGEDIFLAYLQDLDVGYAIGKSFDKTYASQGIFVKPEFRRRGIATELKKAQVDFARSLGCSIVETEIWGDNPASVRLQRRAGFDVRGNPEGYSARLVLT